MEHHLNLTGLSTFRHDLGKIPGLYCKVNDHPVHCMGDFDGFYREVHGMVKAGTLDRDSRVTLVHTHDLDPDTMSFTSAFKDYYANAGNAFTGAAKRAGGAFVTGAKAVGGVVATGAGAVAGLAAAGAVGGAMAIGAGGALVGNYAVKLGKAAAVAAADAGRSGADYVDRKVTQGARAVRTAAGRAISSAASGVMRYGDSLVN